MSDTIVEIKVGEFYRTPLGHKIEVVAIRGEAVICANHFSDGTFGGSWGPMARAKIELTHWTEEPRVPDRRPDPPLAIKIGVLPMIVSKTGSPDEPISEVIICDSISGGADYRNEMPNNLTLRRTTAEGKEYTATYFQVEPAVSKRIDTATEPVVLNPARNTCPSCGAGLWNYNETSITYTCGSVVNHAGETKSQSTVCRLEDRVKHLERGIAQQSHEVLQICGKVLNYPWYKDDQKNFPDATEADGVCTGENVPDIIVQELANKYTEALVRLNRMETKGNAMYAYIDPASPSLRTSEVDNLLQGWDDSKQGKDLQNVYTLLLDKVQQMAVALHWYAEQVSYCNVLGENGVVAHINLAKDSGYKAKEALKGVNYTPPSLEPAFVLPEEKGSQTDSTTPT